ncbi:MAG: UDP-N-acetylmuramoyl-tripeptide--D-alanyl-D-alanine ligase [Chitinivibrionales bacterium]|nr:UDP-N-acetylmuramoyl-tripeptide--D-alanyl-D-alanine ligase [Chitinivibrionales bacterium]MBD3394819.1 UDP-N-acetylmuramoyl-tripeptide--D-alanyl-D-alanine ligase [Chitinivibrionales bacterium]
MRRRRKRSITLGHLVRWGRAQTRMSDARLRMPLGDLWMDSRKVKPGDVFLALQSASDDGHRYVGRAFEAGAVAAIVDRARVNQYPAPVRKKLIGVADPLAAVGRMATAYRRHLNIPVIAVTGSNGKTTTRRFIAAVLREQFVVGETGGNWNNHIGVPLTILRFMGDERIGVVELAANHQGEIGTLSRIVEPDIAVITNIGYAHIGLFGGLKETVKTKFEITKGFRRRSSVLLVNGDDRRLNARRARGGWQTVSFGMTSRCAVRAGNVTVSENGSTSFEVDGGRYRLSMPGRHFVYSALPAIFAGAWFGVPRERMGRALAALEADPLRGRIARKAGVTFIVDCYNANPSSMQSAIKLLADVARGGRTAAVVGDMLELGKYSTRLHRQLGARLAAAGVAVLVAAGAYARHVADGARGQGMHAGSVRCVPDASRALGAAKRVLRKGDTVLLKGSRAMRLETVFQGYGG